MITILDMFLIFLTSIILVIVSLALVILPFSGLENNIILYINHFLRNIQGVYIISIIGVVVLIMGLKMFSILFKKNRDKNHNNYITQWNDYGEVKISINTIIGLVKSVGEKFTGLKNINVSVDVLEGKLFIEIKGETSSETNIPEMTKELQKKVKEHVESCAGVEVNEVKIYITNVSQPVRNLR